MRDLPDEALAARVRDGDEAAASLLFERHVERLRAQVRRQLPARLGRKVAESDVIQEAYLAAFRRLADFEDKGEGSFGRWLRGILEHKIHDEVRRHLERERRSVRREVSRDRRPDTDALPRGGASPSAQAVAQETRETVLRALERLPEDYQRVLRLVHDDGLTVPEAAARIGRTSEASRKLYSRAVSKLAEEMQRRSNP